jgi:hypothetical protein
VKFVVIEITSLRPTSALSASLASWGCFLIKKQLISLGIFAWFCPKREPARNCYIDLRSQIYQNAEIKELNNHPSKTPSIGTSRLLKKKDAAAYCSVSEPTFDKICPILPLVLTAGGSSVRRYDKMEIDGWIDSLRGLNDNSVPPKEAILRLLDS